jgi:hypothetical protein
MVGAVIGKVSSSISSVIVNHFDLVGAAGRPAKADAPLIVDPDAVLPFAVAAKGL